MSEIKTIIEREIVITEKPHRHAVIKFTNGAFCVCKYYTKCPEYDLDDWRFLKTVAEEIIGRVEKEKELVQEVWKIMDGEPQEYIVPQKVMDYEE